VKFLRFFRKNHAKSAVFTKLGEIFSSIRGDRAISGDIEEIFSFIERQKADQEPRS
jgi:hypothetical protein